MMKRIEKGTWHSRVEEILCRDFGNIYSKLTKITQQTNEINTGITKGINKQHTGNTKERANETH